MLHPHHRMNLFLTFFFLAATILVIPAEAAAPRLLMIYGKQLPKPVVMSNWQENQRLTSAITEEAKVRPEELKGRPYFELAFFWGLEWVRYVDQGKPLDKLRPKQANQHGRFYPAVGDANPIVVFKSLPGPGSLIRQVKPEGVEILARYGIPVKTDALNVPGR